MLNPTYVKGQSQDERNTIKLAFKFYSVRRVHAF